MRAVIFANGQLTRPILLQPDDLVIAADGGTHHCLGLGIRPHVVIGDLDSVREDELEALSASGTEIITYPERKDFTDLELALLEAQKRGADRVLILAALGKRWDQSLANLLLPVTFPGLNISLLDDQQEIHFIRPGKTLEVNGQPGDTVSLIPLSGDASGITTHGLEYPLYQEMLQFGSTRGISNVMLGSRASVKLGSGLLLCAVIHQVERVKMNAEFISKSYRTLLGLLILALISACAKEPAPTASPSPSGPGTLRVMTHDSFSISEGVLAQFENENNTKVQFLKSGDTGTALNKAILSKDNPLADVFYGVDNTFLSRALDEGIFIPYASPRLGNIPDAFKLDPQNRALPVDYGDVCLNYDRAYFTEHNLQPPQSLDDLLKPEYKGLLVVQNPATSSPGLAFLLATIGVKGDPGYLDYWKGLVENELLVVNDWETAYYTEFSGSSGKGPRPIVVSYNSSPVFELIYAGTPLEEPPTAAVVADDTCFRQIEFVGILQGGQNHDLAEKWIDFMLSTAFQEDLPMQMFVFPVSPAAKLDKAFVDFLQTPGRTAQVSPQEIAANREGWLKAWTEAVLR